MKQLLLIGAGHAHAQVLLDWLQAPLPGVALTLVSPTPMAPYSGMVPGWLAGHYAFEDICIRFDRLAAAAGVRWLPGELASLDAQRARVQLASGETLPYDLLSLNNGSTLNPPPLAPGDGALATLLPLRPLSQLQRQWDAYLAAMNTQPTGAGSTEAPLRVTAVGGGAAGFESLLAVMARLRRERPSRPVQGRLVSRGAQLLPGLPAGAVRAAERALAQAGAELLLNTPWQARFAEDSGLIVWATGAEAHAWQRDPARRGGLAVSERGFIRVNAQLQSVSQPGVFAVGDCAEWSPALPKAGVYAVRMGPVLSRNLRAALGHTGPAIAYQPQRQFLALLATADGRAIGTRGRLWAQARWLWRWKDHIDRGFVQRFSLPAAAAELPHTAPPEPKPLNAGDPR